MIFNTVYGSSASDGNDIEYPIAVPSSDNKLYQETSVNNIALAIDEGTMTIAEMAAWVRKYRNAGIEATYIVIESAEYQVVEDT